MIIKHERAFCLLQAKADPGHVITYARELSAEIAAGSDPARLLPASSSDLYKLRQAHEQPFLSRPTTND
jgi:hypothetical protein